jgi:hypothetical protein
LDKRIGSNGNKIRREPARPMLYRFFLTSLTVPPFRYTVVHLSHGAFQGLQGRRSEVTFPLFRVCFGEEEF